MNNDTSFNCRAIEAVKYSWDIYSKKVGGGKLQVNKEASMQLHFAYILQQIMPLIIFEADEHFDIELETSISDGTETKEADLMLTLYKGNLPFRIVIEMKCYKKMTSSGKPRGATDIFMKDVYTDLHLLERYCENDDADYGIALVMTDHKYFVNTTKKNTKCWEYDITHGTVIAGNKHYTTPIGGKPVDIIIKHQYKFDWHTSGKYYFALLEKIN